MSFLVYSFSYLYDNLIGSIGRKAQFEFWWKTKDIFSAQHQTPAVIQLGSVCSWVGCAYEWNECWLQAIFTLVFLLKWVQAELVTIQAGFKMKASVDFIFSLLDLVFHHWLCDTLWVNTRGRRYLSDSVLKWIYGSFISENTFCSGDHVSWHSPLDNSESRIQHMLLTEDPQMQPIQTPFGTVAFLQVSSNTNLTESWCEAHFVMP